MKKICSLIKANMSSGMNIFRVKSKNNNPLLPIVLSFMMLFLIGSYTDMFIDYLEPLQLQFLALSLGVLLTSIVTIVEGVYKAGPLLFNCKDDLLLLSLPIKRKTVLFVRLFKFYVFELLFNSIFLLPIIIVYAFRVSVDISYYFTSFIMILTVPIIPIIISSIVGTIISSISSKFKYKNVVQIVTSMIFVLLAMFISFKLENIMNYVIENANTINEIITKMYYPAGIYIKLVLNFNILDLLIYIIVNVVLVFLLIFIIGKFYFKINSRLKNITINKKTSIRKLKIKSNNKTISLIKKELNTFFKTPVFIVNAGFGLVLFLIMSIAITIKFDSLIPVLTEGENSIITSEMLLNNKSIIIFFLIAITSCFTSITSSVISLEGRNINILKSLPIKVEKILMSKIFSSLILTTPVLLLGDIFMFIRFKTNIIEIILLIIISIIFPLIFHFIGLLMNLRYPKLDAENSTEVVKQSTSSILSVLIGVVFFAIINGVIISLISLNNPKIVLLISVGMFLIIDGLLYIRLVKKGVKRFNSLFI